MKCSICGKNIEEVFLKKPVGTWVKDAKGKKRIVCASCQRKYPKKEEMLKASVA